MRRFLLAFLLFPITAFATQYYLEGNIVAGRNRFFKLDDGSYWQVQLDNGYFSTDRETGCGWWRFDPIVVEEGEGGAYPYRVLNRRNGEVVLCKQVDPALPESTGASMAICVHYSCSQGKNAYSPYVLDANIFAGKHRFFRLDDGSYWEVKLERVYFKSDHTTGALWKRGDQVKIDCSQQPLYPYVLINQRSEEGLLCRQVDPALPESTHTVVHVDKEIEHEPDDYSSDLPCP